MLSRLWLAVIALMFVLYAFAQVYVAYLGHIDFRENQVYREKAIQFFDHRLRTEQWMVPESDR